MIQPKSFKCVNCEATLDLSRAINGTLECEYCHSKYTLPKDGTSEKAKELLNIASHELDTCSFDRAYTAYEKAAQADESEPEAYFGMALASFKVQYLKDCLKNCLQPICHDITDKKFADDRNFQRAAQLATSEQRVVYEQKAAEIDAISEAFYRLSHGGVKYDCFICVKVSDHSGGFTQDSYEAMKIYNHLKKRGYNPFYSEEEIRGKTGAEYEAHILYALYTSECMLVVCSDETYLQTPWVKNEYTRFMELINDERKDTDAITIVFRGKPIERLPGKRALIQGVNLISPDAYITIEDYVKSHTPQARKRREEEIFRKQREDEEIKRRIEEQERKNREQEQRNRKLEEDLRDIKNSATGSASADGATVNSLLIRAKQFLEADDAANAMSYYNKVLDVNPKIGEAWWGVFKCKYNIKSDEFRMPLQITHDGQAFKLPLRAESLKKETKFRINHNGTSKIIELNFANKDLDANVKTAQEWRARLDSVEFKRAFEYSDTNLRAVIEKYKSDFYALVRQLSNYLREDLPKADSIVLKCEELLRDKQDLINEISGSVDLLREKKYVNPFLIGVPIGILFSLLGIGIWWLVPNAIEGLEDIITAVVIGLGIGVGVMFAAKAIANKVIAASKAKNKKEEDELFLEIGEIDLTSTKKLYEECVETQTALKNCVSSLDEMLI